MTIAVDLGRKATKPTNQPTNKRKRINHAGRQAVRGLSHGRAIIHELDPTTPGLYKNDGTHLTLIGNAIFLNTFKEALNIFLTDNT